MTGFWMGHPMLGDVLGFCAAAHLFAAKVGHSVQVWFDPSRKDACQYFDGVEWVPLEALSNPIDCGLTPTLDEWPLMNGVKRFYRYMDPSLQPTKSFDIHFNRPRPKSPTGEQLIGLITHSNTQGDIDDATLEEMLATARRQYPAHQVVLIGNQDNSKLPSGVADWRQAGGDISWIIDAIARLDLLITPQSGPCFIAAGWGVPMWVYRSKESFWDYTLNYDTYRVERWWERRPPVSKSKTPLYINWKSGLGDAILHVSLYYHYARHSGQLLHFYGNSKLIDRKMREFVALARRNQPDIDQWIKQVPFEQIRAVDGGPEDFSDWEPIPSDNCLPEYWQEFDCTNFISCMVKVMKFGNVDRPADGLDFPHDYLRYSSDLPPSNRIVFHLIGTSSGSYANNYEISSADILQLIERFRNQGYEIVFLQPHDDWMRQAFPWATFRDHGADMEALFNEIASARAVFAVDSGVAHAALCCGTPLYLFKIQRSNGLGFGSADGEYIHAQTELLPTAAQARIVPRIPTRRQPPASDSPRLLRTSDGLYYRDATTDYDVIHSVMQRNEYGLTRENVAGKTVLDIGGNIGAFSVMCARLGAAEITCFEPVLDSLVVLRKNVAPYRNITPVGAAIGRSDQYAVPFAQIAQSGNNYGGAHVLYANNARDLVPIIKLDDVFEQVDILKLDCEGSEFPILYTTKKLKQIGFITGEFHNFREGDSRYSPHIVRGFSITDYTIEGLAKYLETWEMKTEYFYYADGIGFFKAWHK